jgi:hypothetical protein
LALNRAERGGCFNSSGTFWPLDVPEFFEDLLLFTVLVGVLLCLVPDFLRPAFFLLLLRVCSL